MLDSFFYWDKLPVTPINSSYDFSLVALSFVIAVLASYVALDMAFQQGREQSRRVALFWHIGGAIAMGAGIWSMHFTGMLSYNMNMEHSYNLGTTLLSLAIPIIFSYIVLQIVKTRNFELSTILLAAPFLGIGIAAMHYTGMAAMEMKAALRYTPGWFAISIVIAISASAAALTLSFLAIKSKVASELLFKMLSAVVMGAAICGMHYTGMQAAVFLPFADCRFDQSFNGGNDMLAFGVASVTLIILGIAISALTLSQKFMESLKAQVAQQTEKLSSANEALKHAKEQAEAASIIKSEFLANMSHEIRTPMNAVVGLANILQSDKLTPERKKEYLDTLEISARALMRLINELLDISKIEANNIELEHIDFDLKILIEEVIKLLSVRSQEKNINLSLDYKIKQTRFLGDPLRIRQILVNLLSNAVKFTDRGGVNMTVESHETATAGLCHVTITVIDTGIGIPPEKLATIFEKFTQGESSTTRKYGGSGLGLAICKGLSEKMGGSIRVKSSTPQGSVFILSLPLNISTAVENSILAPIAQLDSEKRINNSVPDSANNADRARILLVDDNQVNVLITSTYLQNFGFNFDIANNGMMALEKYRSQYYALILMDIQMPGMNGYEITHYIREVESRDLRARTPIIAMTAFASIDSKNKCLEAGMDEYIAKPFQPEELESKISIFISHSAEKPS